ncbi:MAG: 23S rRNA (uracil(1939)-C(5))-methyltransferase RlmD [Atopobiaceae bacterium]|nr:23S rRNA (uracil(1939)-C(5))-methyltransferase RlmD [Atopobiaceae bacterium]
MGYKTYTCPIAKHCGGCELLAVPYPIQLKRKQHYVAELFDGLVDSNAIAIYGMDNPVQYRHKAATPFAPGPKGQIHHGFYERGTHRIVSCRDCLVEHPACREVIEAVARTARLCRISAYNEDAGVGLLRHAIVRVGCQTNEILLTLVANGKQLPREQEFVQRLIRQVPQITSIALNVNQRNTNAMLGRSTRILNGAGHIHDSLLGCQFEIGPTSFYQTNPEQAELLYRLAIEGLHLDAGDTLLDAYCGIGSIGLSAAKLVEGIKVFGVEKGRSAIADAKRNARLNGLDGNCHFVAADAGDYMRASARRKQHFDAVILDPPRAGASQEFLDALVLLSPRKLSYISCNPQTQRRDIELLLDFGYVLDALSIVDMFPHTKHVETVALLSLPKH